MRSLTILAVLATTFTSTQAFAQVVASSYSIELNKTKIVRLPKAASAVLVGNPNIADVSVHSVDTLFVVGRGFGETNLIVLDQFGEEIMDANLTVVNTLPTHGVRLFNARRRETYSCIPYCQPSPVLGDTPTFIGQNSNTRPAISSSFASSNTRSDAGSSRTRELAGGSNDDNDDNITPN